MAAYSTEKYEKFSQKMTNILNYGALNLAMSIGYKLRLFDVLDEFTKPETASAISSKAGLNERYTTEWLGVMVCGGIVELSNNHLGDDLFFLPKEHADLITRRAGDSNLGVYTQEIPLLTTCAEEHVIKGFSTGQGIEYEKYTRFQQFMTQLSDAKHRQTLVETFLASVEDGVLIKKLTSGIRVCDLGCGEGVALALMAEAFPNSEFVGIDISTEAIQAAKKTAQQQNLQNVNFLILDSATLPDHSELSNFFDYVTAFDAIHDQTRPFEALKGIYAILKPDGMFTMVDIAASSNLGENADLSMGPFLYTVSLMHCMPVGLVNEGAGLGMMWGRQKAAAMLKKAGFQNIEVLAIPHDTFNLHFFARKPKLAI